MAVLEPGDDGFVVGFGYFDVSEYAVFYPFFQGFYDWGCSLEVHVGNP